MQSPLSQLLIREHDVIQEAGGLISLNRGLWRTSPVEYEQKVNLLLDFFSLYADEYHHRKEEEIVFPAIGKKNELISGGIVQELLEHHEYFRALTGKIKISLEAKEFGETQELLETYITILKDHIAVENDELFPMADDIFNSEELEKLYHKCIDKDREMGFSLKEEWEDRIKKFTLNNTNGSIAHKLQ